MVFRIKSFFAVVMVVIAMFGFMGASVPHTVAAPMAPIAVDSTAAQSSLCRAGLTQGYFTGNVVIATARMVCSGSGNSTLYLIVGGKTGAVYTPMGQKREVTVKVQSYANRVPYSVFNGNVLVQSGYIYR